MTIKIVKGDLLTVNKGLICHQVNCQGVMGSGVAKQIKEKYPQAFKEYKQTINDHLKGEDLRRTLLGRVNGVKVGNNLYIANMFGQFDYGYDGKVYTDTEALYNCFKIVRGVAERVELPVHMPYMIGCFRGGADWKEVEDLLLTAFEDYEVTLFKLP